jgi:ATP-dependent exoDNAse (exonuclease V) alpha subunit
MKTVKVDEIVRQKTPELKTAVHAAIAGNVREAFKNIDKNIIEADKPERSESGQLEPGAMDQALAEATFKAWNAMPADKRDATGIAAPTHVIRQSINALVREQLEKEGRIVGPEKEIKALKSAAYTTAEKGRAKNYFEGDQVIFNRERNGVEQGEVLSVVVSNSDTNTIAMLRENGNTVIYKPDGQRAAQSVDILRSTPLGIRQGDLIRFTRNDESLGLINSGMAEITDIDKQGNVSMIKEDGSKLTLEGDAPALRFIDHAWTSTVHAFQGRTVDNIIGVMHSSHPHLSHQKAFYVEISRARESATLITDDRQRLGATLTQETGERIAALEATPEDKSFSSTPEISAETTPEISVSEPDLQAEQEFDK